jgi:AraC-like DNA-binding protein
MMTIIQCSSVRSIYRAFQHSRGYSPKEFVRRQRLLKTHRRLEERSAHLTVTSSAFAFSDVSYFGRDKTGAVVARPQVLSRTSSELPVRCPRQTGSQRKTADVGGLEARVGIEPA